MDTSLLNRHVHADHDMIYLEPFRGHKEIRQYFEKVVSIVPPDLKFTVEDITDGDPHKVGVKWCALDHSCSSVNWMTTSMQLCIPCTCP